VVRTAKEDWLRWRVRLEEERQQQRARLRLTEASRRRTDERGDSVAHGKSWNTAEQRLRCMEEVWVAWLWRGVARNGEKTLG
jgi:hypothetical protein